METKKAIFVLCLLILGYNSLNAQEDRTLNSSSEKNKDIEHLIDSMPIAVIKGKSFDFVFRINTIHEYNKYIKDSMHYFNVHAIEIYHFGTKSYTRDDPKFLQRFQIKVEMLELRKYNEIPARLVDVNFDGYEDLEVLDIPGMYWNSFQYYVYDPINKKFKEDTFLNQLKDPTFNKEQKYVHYSWHIGPNEFGHAVYQWQENTLLLIGKEVQSYVGTGDDDQWSYYAEKRVNGEMKEVEYIDGILDSGSIKRMGPCSMITHGDKECELFNRSSK